MKNNFFKRSLPLFILLVGLVLFFYFNLNQYLDFAFLKRHRQMLLLQVDAQPILAAFIFILVYILAIAISMPGAIFLTLIGGFLFGIFWGMLYVLISATIGATVIFLATRLALEPLMAKKTNQWVEKMREGFKRHDFQYLLFLRLIPLFPFWVINIVPALLGMKTKTYMLATFIGIIPGSLVYVALGSGLGHIFNQNETPNLGIIFQPQILLPMLGLALLSLFPLLYKQIRK